MSAVALCGFEAFDQLATMVAVAGRDGRCVYANSTLEDAAAVSRSALRRGNVTDWFIDPRPMRDALHALQRDAVSTARFDARMKRAPLGASEALPVRVSVSLTDSGERVLLEMVEIEQQTRQEREERTLGLVQANKELLRNLAHEVKNPLGGIRGAAQLLQMELASRAAASTPRSSSTKPIGCRRWSTGCWRRIVLRSWWATSTSTRCASACGC